MWANAQRDGRPAEYRWRSLFNAAKFGCMTPTTRVTIIKPKDSLSTRFFHHGWRRADMFSLNFIMAALRSRCGHYIIVLWFLLLSSFFLSFYLFFSPNLSGRRLDVYHTSTHGLALVRI